MSNKSSVFTNLIWRLAERSGAQLVSFVVSLVLARLLDPELYGTIALVIVFTTILQVFVDSGLGNALIQKKDADNIDFSTVFYTNIVFCLVLYIIIFLSAPFIAAFFKDPQLIPLVRVLSLTVLISGVKNVQQAYVSRNMLFKKFFFSTLGGTIAAAVVGIVMAASGMGVWALVAQQIINLTIDTTILWFTVKWRPLKVFSFERLKTLYSFGWKLLVSALLDTLYNNVRQLIIGKLYTKTDLAFYNKGKQFPNIIVTNVNSSIDSVLLPAMSSEQDNSTHVKNMTRRAIKTSIYIMAPLMMGLAFTAPVIVKLLLTDKWLPCVPFLRIFCITYMFYPIHTANLNAIKALGHSEIFLKLEIIKKVIGLILMISTMWFGVMVMAYSLLLSSVISQIINSWPNRKLLNYSYIDQIKDIMPGMLLAVFMGACVGFIGYLKINTLIVLAIQIVVGILVYVGGSVILKLDSFNYLLGIIKPVIGRSFSKKTKKEA
ncbi:MAG: lipopolysaccharide biosynthesis protein [Oscillospiraceae bacterium]|nr:lipopolysaccharide biosynthesis protein [Oscillospiraceae bacterium]